MRSGRPERYVSLSVAVCWVAGLGVSAGIHVPQPDFSGPSRSEWGIRGRERDSGKIRSLWPLSRRLTAIYARSEMRIDPKGTIAGYPSLQVRRALRQLDLHVEW